MIRLKDLLNEMENANDIRYESPDETGVEYYDDLNRIVKESGINILSDKELNILAIKNERCVGALYISTVGNVFSFDIVVDKSERNQGIGNELFEYGMGLYKELSSGGDYVLELDVVNPYWVKHHIKRGLKIVNTIGNHTIMTI
jgi:hypothetical protein